MVCVFQVPFVGKPSQFPSIATEADIARVEKSVHLYGERIVPTYSDTEDDYSALATPISSSYPQVARSRNIRV
jgi:hypothetical protein